MATTYGGEYGEFMHRWKAYKGNAVKFYVGYGLKCIVVRVASGYLGGEGPPRFRTRFKPRPVK